MAKPAKTRPPRSQIPTGLMITLIVSAVLCVAAIFFAAIIGSPQSHPHFLRGLFIGLRDMLLSDGLIKWYDTVPAASLVVKLVCVVLFLWMLVNLFLAFIAPVLKTVMKAFLVRRDAETPEPDTAVRRAPSPPKKGRINHSRTAPHEIWLARHYEQAEAICNDLNRACLQDGFAQKQNPLPLVRVQVFDVRNGKDYLLTWNYDRTASIPISSSMEIALEAQQDGTPCILGCPSQTDPHQQERFPLEPGVPLSIFRDGGANNKIRRYAITWIGGGSLC